MSRYEEVIATYYTIHRYPQNRTCHAFGIPLIMTSVIAATSYVRLPGEGAWACVNLATVLAVFTVWIVFSWSRKAGFSYLALVAVCYGAAQMVTIALAGAWAAVAIGLGFALGWGFQFLGHGFEGKSPQFVKRPENLLLGAVMMMAELVPAIRPIGLRAASVTHPERA